LCILRDCVYFASHYKTGGHRPPLQWGPDRTHHMKIEGQFSFENIPITAVWNFLTDPDRIASCLPGCEKLIPTAEDGAYDMTLTFGVGAIRGKFSGSIRLHDIQPTTNYGMTVSGNG